MGQELSKKREWMHEVRELLAAQDDDKSGTLTWDELQRHWSDVRVKQSFQKIGVDIDMEPDMKGLFDLFDYNGDGQVLLTEFVWALAEMNGNARGIDVARLKYQVQQLHQHLLKALPTESRTDSKEVRPMRAQVLEVGTLPTR